MWHSRLSVAVLQREAWWAQEAGIASSALRMNSMTGGVVAMQVRCASARQAQAYQGVWLGARGCLLLWPAPPAASAAAAVHALTVTAQLRTAAAKSLSQPQRLSRSLVACAMPRPPSSLCLALSYLFYAPACACIHYTIPRSPDLATLQMCLTPWRYPTLLRSRHCDPRRIRPRPL
jgi:hypothetical protein